MIASRSCSSSSACAARGQRKAFAPNGLASTSSTSQQQRPVAQAASLIGGDNVRAVVTRVAAVDEPATRQEWAAGVDSVAFDPELEQQLAVAELDSAQEDLLKWMLFLDGEEQEADLEAGENADEDGDGDAEFADLYDEVEQRLDEAGAAFKVGEKVFGTVYEVDEDGAYVEIGAKTAGFVPLTECSLGRLKSPLEALRPGMKREFVVVEDGSDESGEVVLSLAAAEAQVFWQRARQLLDEDVAVTVTVVGATRGGLAVRYEHLEGFIPVSQIGGAFAPGGGGGAAGAVAEQLEALVGSELPAKFLEVDEEAERLVLSHRRASGRAGGAAYRVGDVVVGVVQSVRPYGAFVDIGGAVGLLHISQITHERLTTAEQVLAEGDKLKVMVLSQDSDRGRVTLSTKKLEPQPGDMLRDPQKVFEQADRMAEMFRARVAEADAAGSLASASFDGAEYYPPPGAGYAEQPAGAFDA